MSETKTIQERIIEFIAPMRVYIQNDGGDVTFKSFDPQTKVLVLETAGHCLGCSSYDSTYTFGLREWILSNFADEVKDVIFKPKTLVEPEPDLGQKPKVEEKPEEENRKLF